MVTAAKKKRIKMRGNRKSIEQISMGLEPSFTDKNQPTPEKFQSAWADAANWYNYFYDVKDYAEYIIKYSEDVLGYSKGETATLNKLQPWVLNEQIRMICLLHFKGLKQPEIYYEKVKISIAAKLILASKIIEESKTTVSTKPVVSIQHRMKMKMYDTIYVDWDYIIDGWIENDFNRSIDTYELFKKYELKGQTIKMFGDVVRGEYEVISDAVNKTCEQAVEAYSHIKLSNLKKMLKTMDDIFNDLDRLKDAAKAARVPRAKKPKASDLQVTKLNYCPEDIASKLQSINPIMIPTASRLYVYNVKTRKFTMYTSDTAAGFEVRGSTLYNWDEGSKMTTLRKPDEVLPMVLKKTVRQIDTLWQNFTTKVTNPNGRINKDCIIMRVEK